jgi:hypothetical protein
MSYRAHLGQVATSTPPASLTAAPWVNGLTFLENLAQELNRVGGTFDTSRIQSDVTGASFSNIANRSVRVVQTAPDTVVVTVDLPQNVDLPQSPVRDTFTIVGTYAPMIIMRAYTLSKSGFSLDTGLLRRRVTTIVIGMALSFWWGVWWEKQKEKLRAKYRRTA